MCCASLLETVTEKSATGAVSRGHHKKIRFKVFLGNKGIFGQKRYLGKGFGCPVVVGAGKRFFPDDVRLKLELVDEHRFRNGVVFLRYVVRG